MFAAQLKNFMIDGGIYSVAEIALAELNFTSYYLYVFLILMILDTT